MPEHTLSARTAAPKTGNQAYRFSFFRSIETAGYDWDVAAPKHDLFLQRDYLGIVENHPPHGMRFGYLVFYRENDPIGVALCQIKYFKADESLTEDEQPRKDPCFFVGLAKWFKRQVTSRMAADILINGNMLLTGEHGSWFDYGKITPAQAASLLESALNHVCVEMEKEGSRIPFILVKDLAPEKKAQRDFLVKKGFAEFDIQPNMVLELSYRDFDDYLSHMSTKYRTRAKRAFKKGQALEKRELSLGDIQRELPRLYSLYRDIARNAGFNMVDLNESYLPALKRDLPEHFRMFAYYLDSQLLAFYTTIRNGDELEAHFLGYDKAHNHDLQIYLNILYEIVQQALQLGCKRVIFARTALEIKSSVGAEPHSLLCYLRNQNPLANSLTATLLDYFKPVEAWQQRHPFKHETE